MKSGYCKRALLAVFALIVTALLSLGAKTSTEKVSDKKDEKEKERLALPVAKVNDTTLTLEYVEQATSRQSPILRRELADEAKLNEFVDRLINMELLAEEAARRGFKDHDEVASVLKNQLASLMHRQIADSIEEVTPDEEALKKYYNDNQENYHKPEKVRARHILISDKAKAEKLLADLIEKKKVSQHEFRRLAQENSEDESTRLRGGDLTFFTRVEDRKEGDPEIDEAIVNAVFKLKKNGDIHQKLVKTDKGYHIIMRTGHRDKMDLSFEDSRDRLVVLVRREQRKQQVEDAIASLKERFPVEIHEENLKHVVIDLSVGPPDPNAKGGLTPQEKQKRQNAMVPMAVQKK